MVFGPLRSPRVREKLFLSLQSKVIKVTDLKKYVCSIHFSKCFVCVTHLFVTNAVKYPQFAYEEPEAQRDQTKTSTGF